MTDWENDPYYTSELEPGWSLHPQDKDLRPPVSRVTQRIDGGWQKPLEMETRDSRPALETKDAVPRPRVGPDSLNLELRSQRGEKSSPAVGPPANRTEVVRQQPFHQRVRLEDLERLGIDVEL